ncbi:MAG: hypothetical protein GF317_19890 [Candidatus Lokiarchaeota archaeon]|nr:hypothetical protein [Candidatus Lokiarchaeota archaeon]MBD3201755.1 hypothetical protein [Candidatus Lokiarchaeota archaeon]
MPRGRKARKAPEIEPDPLDQYSAWDKRIAKTFYYGVIVCSAIFILGIWGWILELLITTGKLAIFMSLHIGLQIAIIAAAVTGHLLLLVLFYTLFKGGILKICRALFKDRVIAKKYEDYTTLRWLIGVTVIGGLTTVFFLLIGLVPSFSQALAIFFIWMFGHLEIWRWILDLGLFGFIIIGIAFFIFYFWNHGVYYVLRNMKQIEEEIEVDERIRRERLQDADESTLRKIYKKETGKRAIYKGKETKGYIEWKRDNIG